MRIARVVGNLTCTIKDPAHESRKMMLVRFLDDKGEEIEDEHVYADASDCGVGDIVLVSEEGSAAQTEFELDDIDCTLDGVIVGVIDRITYDRTINA